VTQKSCRQFLADLAYLENDAPTREEFGDLEKRVEKVESKTASV